MRTAMHPEGGIRPATHRWHGSARVGAAVALTCWSLACRPAPPPRQAPPPAAGPRQINPPPPVASLAAHPIVPAPAEVVPATGSPFTITAATSIVVSSGSGEVAGVAEYLAALLRPSTALAVPVRTGDAALPAGAIGLRLGGPASLGDEGYELVISADSVRLTARAPAGLFRGVQTLRQLLPAGIEAEQGVMQMATAWTAPPGRIVDGPRFGWRGAMLDVARHFFTVDEVKQYIDLLALYKLNVLHLHLTDDQGWRIQIDAWPRLTTVGGSSEVGGGTGGFYTKADYAEIVRYAQARFITIVPEIDLPGHTGAAIAAYPELGCSRPIPGNETSARAAAVYTGIQVGWSTVCPDSALTHRFIDDVVRELSAMTPGPYFHIGGDEVAALTHDTYARFIERVQETVRRHGKSVVGWEEIGKGRLLPGTIAQQWRSDTALLALRQGAKLLLSPGERAYLDMKYTPSTELGLRWAGFVELRAAYDWDPAAFLPGVAESSLVGVEAPLWAESIPNISAAMYLAVPRLPAIAEVAWTPRERRGWEGFRTRIAAHAPRWRLLGVNFHQSPQVAW